MTGKEDKKKLRGHHITWWLIRPVRYITINRQACETVKQIKKENANFNVLLLVFIVWESS